MSKYTGLVFRNEGQKTVEIDIEGTIGGSWWGEDDPESKNTKEKMKAELKRLSNIKADTIIVNINSYGGDVNHGLSIHDLLAENPAKVITKVNGMTASAATIIAMAGDERKISDNSLFLAHRASSWGFGNVNDINMVADDLRKVDDRIINIYTKATGKKREDITEIMDRNNGYGEWISPEEAKEIGFVTEIFEPRKMAAQFSSEILSRFHLPEIPGNNKPATAETKDQDSGVLKRILEAVETFTKGKSSNNSNTKIIMKKFENIFKVLNIEALETSEDGTYLNEEQLDLIEAKLGDLSQAVTDAQTTQQTAEAARQTAEDALTAANTELDTIDESVSKAADIKAKVQAVKAKLAEKPGSAAEGTQADGDVIETGDGIDQTTIDNLPHNREADANM